MASHLLVREDAYVLSQGQDGTRTELATLRRGARALLDPSRPAWDSRLEAAIEVAEDWLMPHAPRLQGEVLEVEDVAGRLRPGLRAVLAVDASAWSVDAFEALFLQLVDLATGRHPAPALQGRELFVADVLLLRELAHHGRLREIRLAAA